MNNDSLMSSGSEFGILLSIDGKYQTVVVEQTAWL
jgi:hypothetical protein